MKNTVWCLPTWLNNFPQGQSAPGDQQTDIKMIVIYVIIWAIVAKVLYSPHIKNPMIFCSLTGFIFIILFHFYEFAGLPIPASQQFLLNKTNHSLNLSQSEEGHKILIKSPFSKLLKKNKNIGVILDAKKYNTMVKNGEIVAENINKWAKKNMGKMNKDITTSGNSRRFWQLSQVSYYLIVNLFSLAMLVAGADIKIFRLIFPWIVLGTFFTLIQANLWIWAKSHNTSINLFLVKRHLFTLGLSFCLVAVTIVLKFNNK